MRRSRGPELGLGTRRRRRGEVRLDLPLERRRSGEAVLRAVRERPETGDLELGGDVLRHRARRQDLAGEDALEDLGLPELLPERNARQHLPHHDPGGVDVRPAVDLLAEHLLGRDVADLTLEESRARVGRRVPRLGDAEVEELDLTVEGHEDVARRDVAMDDAQRRAVVVGELVRVVQTAQHARQHPEAHPPGELLPAARVVADALVAGAFQVLHRDVVATAVLADVVRLHDVGVVEARGQAGLVEEHRDEVLLRGEAPLHHLDDDELVEVAEGPPGDREVDLRHPSVAHLGDDEIPACQLRAHVVLRDAHGFPPFSRGPMEQGARRSFREVLRLVTNDCEACRTAWRLLVSRVEWGSTTRGA